MAWWHEILQQSSPEQLARFQAYVAQLVNIQLDPFDDVQEDEEEDCSESLLSPPLYLDPPLEGQKLNKPQGA